MAEVEMKWHNCPVEEFNGLHRVHPTGRYVSCFGTTLWFSVEYQMDGHKVDMTWWLEWKHTRDWIVNYYEFLRERGLEAGIKDAYLEIKREVEEKLRGEEE